MGLKKGYYFFTLDAIIAIMVILIFIAVIPSLYFNKPQQDSLNYFSEDIIEVLSTLKVAESDNAYVRELISNGTITRLNNSILEQAGEFWALNEAGTAGILLSEVLGSLIPEGYNVEIVMEKDVISSSVEGNARNLVSAKRLISGIKEGEAVLGYTTRVFISGINDLSTSSYAFFGGYVGDGVITQRIQIPEVTSIEEGYLEINSGNNFDLYINEKFCDTFNKTSSDPLIAEKWYLNDSCLSTSYFQPGNNEIKFVFTDNISNFIGGGFIRVKYLSSNVNLTSSSSTIIDKEWIPGIQGVINLFSSFYVPGTLNDLKFYIHFMSNYSIFVNVGNTTVFESNGSSDNQTITLQNLSSVLDFTDLGGKTMPLKIGVSNMSLLSGFGGVSDAVLITDRTGSMSNCDVDSTSCIHPDCSSDAGCQNYRSDVAVDSDNVFIETILSVPGNNLGLIGFGERESPVCSIHDMGDDNLSLSSQVSDYNYGGEWQSCGYTCISCGVVGATKLLMENQALYNLTRVSAVNTSYFQLGDGGAGVSVNETLEVDIDRSKFVKGRLTIFVKKVDTDDGHMDCVYLNDNYLGRACISNEVNSYGWQTCSYPLKPEWVNDGNNTVKITAGTVGTDCDATEGTNDEMYLKETRL
ncbi:hypothetical protein FJZ53_06900, partial [Candidatus Woesearchaeota archaeon]|nr:hypothetical protein [Candidatus Woesearchaeota archaeon]